MGLSKSLEISAKLLIWLTDSECRWAETSLTQPCSSWHLRCWNDSIWMLRFQGGGKKGWKALLMIFGWVQYVSFSLSCSLSLSLSLSSCSTDQTVQRVFGFKATGSLSRTECLFKILGCSWTCSSKLCLVTGNSWQVQWHALWQHHWMLQKQESWLKTQQEIQCILACRQPYRKSG